MDKVLVVDDESSVRFTLSSFLEDHGFPAVSSDSGEQAVYLFRRERPMLVLLDLKMPGIDGMETLRRLREIDATVPVIILTAYGDISTAVEAMKLGAFDFVTKPPDFDRILIIVKKLLEKRELQKAVERLDSEMETTLEWSLGRSRVIKEIIRQIKEVAWSDFSVIIEGETGTGKSYVAQLIHSMSRRAKGPYVAIDLGSMPETLVESELFGFNRGAFTGAEKKRKGFFEAANGGTIFIDELQNISPLVQAKLLRVVEDKRIYPLGSDPLDLDVRILSATNANTREAVRNHRFREDLFFRLSEFMISVPPLRERAEDIPFLAERFIREAAGELQKNVNDIDDHVMDLLVAHPWPGNVRELKNVIRRAVLLAGAETIKAEHVSFQTGNHVMHGHAPAAASLRTMVAETEKRAISDALRTAKGNKSQVARMLGIDYKTLLVKIRDHGLEDSGNIP